MRTSEPAFEHMCILDHTLADIAHTRNMCILNVCRLVHIAVGTPGRVCALVTSGALTLDSLSMFVLDEADALLSDSFYSDVTWLYDQLPRKKQASSQVASMIETYSSRGCRSAARKKFLDSLLSVG